MVDRYVRLIMASHEKLGGAIINFMLGTAIAKQECNFEAAVTFRSPPFFPSLPKIAQDRRR